MSNYGKILDNCYVSIRTFEQARRAKKGAREHVRAINGGYTLSNEELVQLRKFWKRFGKRPEKYWYNLLCAHDGVFDPRYIPNTYWYQDIIPHFNKIILRKAYVDKNLMSQLFPSEMLPRSVVRNVSGRLYGPDCELITKEDAVALIEREKGCIVKPSIESGSGRGINFIDEGESKASIVAKLDKMGQNYIVQEIVSQHYKLAAIHPESLNTIRFLTFFFKGEVRLLSSVLRMGQGKSRVDNIGAGGFQCSIDCMGKLAPFAATADRNWVSVHPNGLVFDGYDIPSYDVAVEMVKREHEKLGHFNIIGWDVAISDSGAPKLIEFNLHPAQNQMTSGPTFGSLTEEVLFEVYCR